MNDHQRLDPNDFFRSNDMGVVTYLRIEGHTSQAMDWEGRTCYWVFAKTPSLMEHVEKFQSDQAQVNPRVYNRRYAETKREFYDTQNDSRPASEQAGG